MTRKLWTTGLLSLAVGVGGAMAQPVIGTGFGIGVVGLEDYSKKPPLNQINCDNLPVDEELVCVKASAEARVVAEEYAQASGRIMGCVDGITQGINDGYYGSSQYNQTMLQEAKSRYANMDLTTAVRMGEGQARKDSSRDSMNTLIKRYRDVVNVKDGKGAQVLPSKEVDQPKFYFEAPNNGFELDKKDLEPQYAIDDAVYELKWIARNAGTEQRVLAKSLYGYHRTEPEPCSFKDSAWDRSGQWDNNQGFRWSFWHYLQAQRKFDFEQFGWRDPKWAWQYILNTRSNDSATQFYKDYIALKDKVTLVKREVPKKDANGNFIPKIDPVTGQPMLVDGRPVYEMEVVTVAEKLPVEDVARLQNKYQAVFTDKYHHYAAQYLYKSYQQQGTQSYALGLAKGKATGELVARFRADRDAYNDRYKSSAEKEYYFRVRKYYEDQFRGNLSIFENNPIFELLSFNVLGGEQDNIFTAGEGLYVRTSAQNLGEKTAPISMDLSGAGLENLKDFNFNLAGLSRVENVESPIMATIARNALAGTNLSLQLGVKNVGTIAALSDRLTVSRQDQIKLSSYVQVERTTGRAGVNNGWMEVDVRLINPSSRAFDASIATVAKITLTIDGVSKVVSKEILSLPANGTTTIALKLDGFDPLFLIEQFSRGGFSYHVDVEFAGKVADRSNGQIKVELNPFFAKLDYFNALVTKQVSNTGNQSLNDRLQDLEEVLFTAVEDEVQQKRRWGKSKFYSGSALEAIVTVYNRGKAASLITPGSMAQQSYDQLAKRLAKLAPSMKVRGLFGKNKHRKAYLTYVAQVSPGLSTDLGAHR